jgi:Quinohemoprotein amine dehydrogenase A, alpha subunit, haem binding
LDLAPAPIVSEDKEMHTSGVRLLFGVVGGAIVMVGAAAAQQADLPAGPNRELVSRKCQGCHDLSVVIEASGQNREDWNATIDEMITSNGMSVTQEERAMILDYLSSYLGPSASQPFAK